MVLSFEPTHCKGIQLCIHLKTPKGLFRYFYLLIDFQSLKLNSTEFGPGILFLVCFGNPFQSYLSIDRGALCVEIEFYADIS